ncbi:hypothetical protein BDV27DRAFT_139542 [Aspergillus caelatus]|uniref:Uncharacterized protein n=1 Tax=Aspergillus caelatus TaxID=61420 RepID=A0A5N6ZI79_9EURO|nr:uncharacterized protein BDV27DRAFT_139542 [Aspergillus caelatus]KAE8357321.1 hypothetical protein BDV27DRAFT_139542 [Aspergillus caelatus]
MAYTPKFRIHSLLLLNKFHSSFGHFLPPNLLGFVLMYILRHWVSTPSKPLSQE